MPCLFNIISVLPIMTSPPALLDRVFIRIGWIEKSSVIQKAANNAAFCMTEFIVCLALNR
jgi:hypothetical protein